MQQTTENKAADEQLECQRVEIGGWVERGAIGGWCRQIDKRNG